MAGHIDHGKTALTKALTGVDTDRLKEEKERNISIEPGYASFINDEQLEVSIIDVPGHERFIRQMIAGVAGIDMVILVIAADEGVMPQTKEHLDILSLLGIEHGLIAMTKVDQADDELLEIVIDDVKEAMKGTFLEKASMYRVDNISKKGIPELTKAIKEMLLQITKKSNQESFRLPIDQVFTVKGQGVVVRGTVYDGEVGQGDRLNVLPLNKEVRVRQIQRHHEQKERVSSGQRTAINIGGISHEEISRGDVLVTDDFYSVSDRVDVVFYLLKDMKYGIKQRQPIKLFIGTSEVMGKIIFFDRNEVKANESQEILCQIQLDKNIVLTRNDRFILRKPTPVETIGGGWIIDPEAKKHRFGKDTIEQLKLKKEGTAAERIESLMKEKMVLSDIEIMRDASVSELELDEVEESLMTLKKGLRTLRSTMNLVLEKIETLLETFHSHHPMRIGMNKAEIVSELKWHYPVVLLEFALDALNEDEKIKVINQYIALHNVTPSLPPQYKTRLEDAEETLRKQGLEVGRWTDILDEQQIPSDLQNEFYYYLIEMKKAYVLDNERLVSKEAVDFAKHKLEEYTHSEDFNLQTARDVLHLTRKNLVPLLELFDRLGYTKRMNNMRRWIKA